MFMFRVRKSNMAESSNVFSNLKALLKDKYGKKVIKKP